MFREQSLLPYSNLTENNSFYAVHLIGFFTFLKKETETASEAFCFTCYSTMDKLRNRNLSEELSAHLVLT
jgi:hypothetical protein